MKNRNILIIGGIILILAFFISTQQKQGLKLAGETLTRDITGTYVHPGETFSISYNVQNPAGPYFFSIVDSMTGGCTLLGSSEIVTTLTSPVTTSGSLTVQAPAGTGTCYFNGDWKLGSDPVVNFAQGEMRVCNAVNCVQSIWAPSTDTVCPSVSFTQTRSITTSPDCGGTACGASSQSAIGTKACGTTSTPGGTNFPNGCNSGVCNICMTYGDGFDGGCTKNINNCDAVIDRTELGCVAQEFIGDTGLRTNLGESAQDWINNGGMA